MLIIGGSGLLGRELVRQSLAAGKEVAATYLTRPAELAASWHPLDLRDRDAVADLMRVVRPNVVINAAFQQYDWSSTADGAAHLALAAAGTRFVHVSSDAVFSGEAVHYDETAMPDPITPYGAAKAAAETAIKAIAPSAVIARTSLIIGGGASQHERRVSAGGEFFVNDIRCPVHVTDLAAALLELADSDHAGIHHVAGTDAISRYELGRLIAERDGLDPARLRSGRRVIGPFDVRLDCACTQRKLRTRLRGAREFLG
ncbi:sugar nucleotide-binding protein [Fodinicola acaciae]|uniref:sugar nucleotide-binding protein n=1 Tax=Fodinicola acaciae TaxID=2681555 RepID=UPI0013D415C0|nr:sugar nucleotide-binding protein [Fodinicola acaciae]